MKITLLFDSPTLFENDHPDDRTWLDSDQAQVAQIEQALRRLGHEPTRLAYHGEARALVAALPADAPELVFNLTQSDHCSNIARLLELLGLRYTGAGPDAIDLTTDKALTHAVLAARGLPVPRHRVITLPDEIALDELPLFAKLRYGDGSYGVDESSLLRTAEAAATTLRRLFKRYEQPILLEELLEGRELSVSLLGNGDSLEVFPIREIDFSTLPPGTPPIVTYHAKWTHASLAYQRILSICPARLEPDLADEIAHISRQVYCLVGCRDYARIDIRLDSAGRPRVIDVNTNPDLEAEVGFTVAAERSGRDYDRMIADVVAAAVDREAIVPTARIVRC